MRAGLSWPGLGRRHAQDLEFSMTRYSYALPLIAGLALVGCSGDDAASVDTDNGTGSTGTGDSAATPPTGGPDDGEESADTQATPADSSGDGIDLCEGVECPDGEACLEGVCFPESGSSGGGVCDDWGEGAWANCADGEACGGGAGCVGTSEEGGFCSGACDTACDCAAPPRTGTASPACEDIAGPGGMPDGAPECFLDCSNGETCPDGQICFGNQACTYDNAETPGAVDPYEGCDPPDFPCDAGVGCIQDDVQAPTVGTCAPPCMDAGDCPDAPDGATVGCGVITGGDDPPDLCHLTCDGDNTCPEGWDCFGNFLCLQPIPVAAEAGFGPCLPIDTCQGAEECYETTVGGSGSSSSGSSGSGSSGSGSGTSGGDPEEAYNVCSQPDCANADECPLPPESGNAVAACGDIGAGDDVCYLDCSGDETCPDLMVCVDATFCAFDSNDVCAFSVGDPSFENGSPNADWTETSVLFNDSVICSVDTCGGGAAATGEFWVWFGGVAMPDDASVEQDILIPADATTLTFQLSIPVVTSMNPELDTIVLLVDGTEEFSATGADAGMFLGYQDVEIDVSGYADDMNHTIRFESHIGGAEMTSIFVDDVTLECG